MNKEVKKLGSSSRTDLNGKRSVCPAGLEDCLKAMKRCLKIPNVENCICFSDAFKVLDVEVNELNKKLTQISDSKNKEKFISIKKEIRETKKVISKGSKRCIGCKPCMASVVFKAYPESLNSIYLRDEL